MPFMMLVLSEGSKDRVGEDQLQELLSLEKLSFGEVRGFGEVTRLWSRNSHPHFMTLNLAFLSLSSNYCASCLLITK